MTVFYFWSILEELNWKVLFFFFFNMCLFQFCECSCCQSRRQRIQHNTSAGVPSEHRKAWGLGQREECFWAVDSGCVGCRDYGACIPAAPWLVVGWLLVHTASLLAEKLGFGFGIKKKFPHQTARDLFGAFEPRKFVQLACMTRVARSLSVLHILVHTLCALTNGSTRQMHVSPQCLCLSDCSLLLLHGELPLCPPVTAGLQLSPSYLPSEVWAWSCSFFPLPSGLPGMFPSMAGELSN